MCVGGGGGHQCDNENESGRWTHIRPHTHSSGERETRAKRGGGGDDGESCRRSRRRPASKLCVSPFSQCLHCDRVCVWAHVSTNVCERPQVYIHILHSRLCALACEVKSPQPPGQSFARKLHRFTHDTLKVNHIKHNTPAPWPPPPINDDYTPFITHPDCFAFVRFLPLSQCTPRRPPPPPAHNRLSAIYGHFHSQKSPQHAEPPPPPP